MIDRRRFLIGAGAAVAGAAAGVVLAAAPFGELPSATAAQEERFTHRGRAVVIISDETMVHITVNGTRVIHVEKAGREFLTHLLPFGTFRTPRKLAEAVIDAEDDGLLVI